MNQLKIITNPDVTTVFNKYPDSIRNKLLYLRSLIIEVAREIKSLDTIEETLKWGEISYLTKNGSTIRIDWKEKNPEQYAIYFKCTSKLIPTFRIVYEDIFDFEDNRAILFKLTDQMPPVELKNCIKAALTYHKVKNKPLLGLSE